MIGLHALYHHFEQEHIHYDPRVKKISRYRAPSAQVAFDTFYAPRLFPHPAPFDLRRAPPDKFLAACERYGPIQDLIEPLQPLPEYFQSPTRPPTTDDATKTAPEATSTKRKTGSDPSQGNVPIVTRRSTVGLKEVYPAGQKETTSSSDEPNSPTTPTDNRPGLSNDAGVPKLDS
jgi:hypothetical protein